MIRVTTPDGQVLEFPSGTPASTIRAAVGPARKKPWEAVARLGLDALPAGGAVAGFLGGGGPVGGALGAMSGESLREMGGELLGLDEPRTEDEVIKEQVTSGLLTLALGTGGKVVMTVGKPTVLAPLVKAGKKIAQRRILNPAWRAIRDANTTLNELHKAGHNVPLMKSKAQEAITKRLAAQAATRAEQHARRNLAIVEAARKNPAKNVAVPGKVRVTPKVKTAGRNPTSAEMSKRFERLSPEAQEISRKLADLMKQEP